MKLKVALVIIYNHRFDKNIELLEDLYKNKFQHIFHVIPFYDGCLKNVIPVYESSFYFSGYISQAFSHLKNDDFTNYFIIADDMIVNPKIDENNLFIELGLSPNEAYCDEVKELSVSEKYWPHLYSAMCFNPKVAGIEITSILPSTTEANRIFTERKLRSDGISIYKYIKFLGTKVLVDVRKCIKRRAIKRFMGGEKEFPTRKFRYPMVGGYSDILIVPALAMPKFAQYCGAFAASDLFVEIAIPTALSLAAKVVKTNNDIELNSGAMWTKTEKSYYPNKFNFKLDSLLKNFPSDKLYLHPIKLSSWKKGEL